jgi:peroxiredoxin
MKQINDRGLSSARGYGIVLAILLLGAVWIWFTRADTTAAPDAHIVAPHTNFHAPAFALDTLNGETYSNENLQGKIVVLNFWATWCPPCRAEMPALDAVQRANTDNRVIILGVNQMEDAQTVETFAREFNLTFPLLRDADGAVSAQYQVSALPTTFFIDQRGVIRNVVIGGSMSRELIQNQINALLQEQAP